MTKLTIDGSISQAFALITISSVLLVSLFYTGVQNWEGPVGRATGRRLGNTSGQIRFLRDSQHENEDSAISTEAGSEVVSNPQSRILSVDSNPPTSPQPPAGPLKPRMTCTGSVLATRTCYFEDLLWDLEGEKFVFYGSADMQPWMLTDRQVLNTTEPWIHMTREVLTASRGDWSAEEFYMDWHNGEEHPAQSEIAESPFPAVHIRTIINLSSIGHFIRDNLAPLTSVPMRFGLDPTEFTWVRWPSQSRAQNKWSMPFVPLLEHYRAWLPQAGHVSEGTPLWPTWPDVLKEAKPKGDGAAAPRYVRFRKLLAGRGSTAMDAQDYERGGGDEMWSRWAHGCEANAWRRMRTFAYANTRSQLIPAVDLKPRVVILDGQPGAEIRMFTNAAEVAEQLKRSLPGVEVEHHRISTLSGQDQMRLLSRTTVLVSNVGSRSFRLLFLPDGAQTILVGPIEDFPDEGPDAGQIAFKEADMCWNYLGYVGLWRYHVRENSEIENGDSIPEGGRAAMEFSTRREETRFFRDQNINLNKDKLLPIVRTALENVRPWSGDW